MVDRFDYLQSQKNTPGRPGIQSSSELPEPVLSKLSTLVEKLDRLIENLEQFVKDPRIAR